MKKNFISLSIVFALISVFSLGPLKAQTCYEGINCNGSCCWYNVCADIHPNGGCYSSGYDCQTTIMLPGCNQQ